MGRAPRRRPGSDVTRLHLLLNGARRRCPLCGSGGLFRGWFTMVDRCPGCGHGFEREEGYWLGAMVFNLAVTEGVFGLLFVGGMVLTWPDVPWTGLLVAALIVNAVVPVAFYPVSKTLWAAADLCLHRPEPDEEAAAVAARDAAGER